MLNITPLFDISKQIVDLYRENLSNAGIENHSNDGLYNFRWTVDFDGTLFQLKFILPPQWWWVEHGRNKTMNHTKNGKSAVVEGILKWLEWKKLVPYPRNGKVPNNKQLAFAIAKKIHKEGFYSPNHQGKHPLEKTLRNSEQYIHELCAEMSKLLGREINQDMAQLFDNLKNFKTI